jgi:hypothetical protein
MKTAALLRLLLCVVAFSVVLLVASQLLAPAPAQADPTPTCTPEITPSCTPTLHYQCAHHIKDLSGRPYRVTVCLDRFGVDPCHYVVKYVTDSQEHAFGLWNHQDPDWRTTHSIGESVLTFLHDNLD